MIRYNIADIIRKVVGPIKPVGAEHIDTERHDNLITMIEVVDMLVGNICRVAANKNRHEASMSRAGKTAHDFLSELKDVLTDDMGIK